MRPRAFRIARKTTSSKRRPNVAMAFEPLEDRTLMATDLTFAVVGDYGSGSSNEAAVATVVKSWNPAFVATVGDNSYPDASSQYLDNNIGQFYHQYIYLYSGSYGSGSSDRTNHFYAALGNHDWDSGLTAYQNYLSLPGNERYYSVTQGNTQLFIVDSDTREPDGTSPTSTQGRWLQSALQSSTATWKLVLFHHAAYSSGYHGDNTWMQWPFQQWGASAVLSGHDHDYERLNVNGLPYFVDGSGGQSLDGYTTTSPYSQFKDGTDYGAMKIHATDTSLTFQFVNASGQTVDTYSLGTVTAPVAPTNLAATAVSGAQVHLSWTDNATNETAYRVDRSTDGTNFSTLATLGSNTTSYDDTSVAGNTRYYYRVAASNSGGASLSGTVSVTTPTAPASVYLSDLSWVSASNGWGPVERNTSNGSSGAGDGRTITLNGVTYTKGLGAHAFSSIVYNLGGQYSSFVSDVGVDDEVGSNGSIVFQVVADGTKIYDSGVMTGTSTTKSINVNVQGVQQLTLLVNDGGDGIDYDHADWAGARLLTTTTGSAPAAPTNLTAFAASSSAINLMWTDNASNETGFKIERSTDGANFSQIATVGLNTTSYSDSGLSASTAYFYRVRATNSAGDSAYSGTASATTQAASGVTYLSDLQWVSAVNGWGPVERDTSNGSSGAGDGGPITLNGVTYTKGLGVHAASAIVFNLNGAYSSFLSDIGLDDEKAPYGTVNFQVYADNSLIYDSGLMTNSSTTKSLNLSMRGVNSLKLVVTDGGDGIDYDHADWAGARLLT